MKQARNTTKATAKATKPAASNVRIAREGKAPGKPETAANEDAGKCLMVAPLKLIEAVATLIATEEKSRVNFNIILASKSKGKFQVVEVKAAQSKAKVK